MCVKLKVEEKCMASFVFNNLLDMHLVEEVDIIIYYNNHYADTCLEICQGMDDCFSVLIEGRIIDEGEVKDDIIEYYNTHFKNNLDIINKLINAREEEFLL